MAQEYDNTNRGQLWKNDKKETDKHPDFTGSLNVDGVEFWVSGWKRRPEQSDKAPALSFSVKMKDDGGNGTKKRQAPQSNDNNVEDDPW